MDGSASSFPPRDEASRAVAGAGKFRQKSIVLPPASGAGINGCSALRWSLFAVCMPLARSRGSPAYSVVIACVASRVATPDAAAIYGIRIDRRIGLSLFILS
jgi:hypothetical protein